MSHWAKYVIPLKLCKWKKLAQLYIVMSPRASYQILLDGLLDCTYSILG